MLLLLLPALELFEPLVPRCFLSLGGDGTGAPLMAGHSKVIYYWFIE